MKDAPMNHAPRMIVHELDYGKQGEKCFLASRPVFRWDVVQAQMIWLHTPAARRTAP